MVTSPVSDRMSDTALVLGGGNALGAYLAGAYERLHEQAVRPDWIIGTSIGAVTGAILAGNAPEQRIEKLTRLWEEATLPTFPMIAARPSSKSTAAKRSGLQLYFNAGCPLPRA